MRRVGVLMALLAVGIALHAAPAPGLSSRVMRAVALLYSQDESGNMRMRCTATAYEQVRHGFRFASAAHCVGDDRDKQSADADNTPFYVTFDAKAEKTFYRATVKAVGFQHKGDDFSVFEADAPLVAAVPLGDERKMDVEDPASAGIINVASPLGLGKQLFHGFVSNVYLDRPVVEGNINWTGTMLLQINAGPGSSGSAIVSEAQGAIVGFLVGTVGGSNVIAIPVSRFKAFLHAVEDGTYAYYGEQKHDR